MKAHVITLRGNDYSERVAQRCIDSANISVRRFNAITPEGSIELLDELGLRWTWGNGYKQMRHKPYGGNHNARVACFLSHYLLWRRCVDFGPMLILEHDAVFVRDFVPFDFDAVCMINDPKGATPRGEWWSQHMADRGPGVFSKTRIFPNSRPDGLAGHSAYVIKPSAANYLIRLVHDIGAWPNDAIMCRQLMGGLEEYYPFITEVQSERSTI